MVPVMAHNYINRCWLTFDYVLLVFVYVIKELPINFPLTSCNIFNFLPFENEIFTMKNCHRMYLFLNKLNSDIHMSDTSCKAS